VKYPSKQEMLQIIGKNVQKNRVAKGLSQVELCFHAGLDISTLSRIEGGKTKSSFETYYKITEILDLPMYKLFMPDDLQ